VEAPPSFTRHQSEDGAGSRDHIPPDIGGAGDGTGASEAAGSSDLLRAAGCAIVSSLGLALVSSACALTVARARVSLRASAIYPLPSRGNDQLRGPLRGGLARSGLCRGQTIAIEWRFTPAGSDARFAELAAELVRLPVDMVVARTTPANRAAQQATSGVPSLPSAWPTRWKPGS